MNSTHFLTLFSGIWIGALLAISFMESWLKFRAPGMTREIGLSAGRLVFRTLNRVEWALFLICTVLYLKNVGELSGYTVLSLLLLILVIQSFVLLPMLDRRANAIIAGKRVPSTAHHLMFILLEISKLLALIAFVLTFHQP